MLNPQHHATQAIQWTSAGSGIEHAEGGGTAKGKVDHGFQIWINVPSDRKMDDPAWGTHPIVEIPQYNQAGVHVRVLAGPLNSLCMRVAAVSVRMHTYIHVYIRLVCIHSLIHPGGCVHTCACR